MKKTVKMCELRLKCAGGDGTVVTVFPSRHISGITLIRENGYGGAERVRHYSQSSCSTA